MSIFALLVRDRQNPARRLKSSLFLASLLCSSGAGLLTAAIKPSPALSAERLVITYGQLEFPLAVTDLETFAQTGEIRGDLKSYARLLKPEQLEQLREFLQRKLDLSLVAVSQIAYSPIGERSLQEFGEILRTRGDVNGFYAMRAGAILAAGQPEGLTLINFLKNFPSPDVRISAAKLLQLTQKFENQAAYQQVVVDEIGREMQAEIAKQPPIDFTKMTDPTKPGPVKFTSRTLELSRDRFTLEGQIVPRKFNVLVYLPEATTQPTPVVVISHGLGSQPKDFAYLGEHLASHGIATIIPQHLGSDATRQESLLDGIVGSNVNPVDFIDRSYDIQYTLNELERLTKADPALAGRFNFSQVVAIGHSFGGYTALALAGAPINFPRLRQECAKSLLEPDTAPMLECLANRLPAANYQLADPRVKAAFAMSPIASIVLGPESIQKIKVPTLIMGGSVDYVANTVREQVNPFIWLTVPEKHFILSIPSGHNYPGDWGANNNPKPGSLDYWLTGPNSEWVRTYINALSLAFVKTYLLKQSEYAVFLNPGYAEYVSRTPPQFKSIRSLTAEQLEKAYGRPLPIPVYPPLEVPKIAQRSTPILKEIAETGVLRVGVRQDAAPFGYRSSNGQLTGYCVDLVNGVANSVQQQVNRPVRVEIMPTTLENRFQVVQKNQVYLQCGPDTIRENLAGLTFSNPFFISGGQFLVRTDKPFEITPLSTLAGERIGVLEKTTAAAFIQQTYPKAIAVPFQGDNARTQAVQAVASGQIRAFFNDGILLRGDIAQKKLSTSAFDIVPAGPMTCEPYGMVLPNNDSQWQETVNSVVDTTGRSLWNKWFPPKTADYFFLNLDFCARTNSSPK